MDERRLIQAARHGDVESFNVLVLHYQDLAYSVAYRILGESAAAADATQEAFFSAFYKLNQFQGEHFKAWLMRIVTNACYDEMRRRQRRPAASLETLYEVSSQDTLLLHNPPASPEQLAQQRDLSEAIQDCLNALPDEQRVVAVLADVEEYAYQEIVEITGLRLGTVKSRLSRARARLRECLQAVRELLPAEYRLMKE